MSIALPQPPLVSPEEYLAADSVLAFAEAACSLSVSDIYEATGL